MIQAIGWTLLLVSLVGVAYTVAAGAAVGWFFSRPWSPDSDFPPVTILTPLHGDEPDLRANLLRLCRQDYPSDVQIVFGCRDPTDPAIQVVETIVRDNPDLDIELVVDSRLYGSNFKISNLINMQRRIRHPVVVMADSDITVRPDYLRRLVAALSAPGVGFASCAYVGRSTGNFWSRVAATGMDHHLLPSIAFGLRIKLAQPCFGPTIALLRSTLERIGGFDAFADQLADDFEIGRAIRALGYGFAIPPMCIGHGCPERSARSLVSHEMRWACTIRVINPLCYAGSVICHPLPWALLAVVALHANLASLAVLMMTLLARRYVAHKVELAAGVGRGAWWLLVARDLLSVGIFLSAYLVRHVNWRGSRFRLTRDGALFQPASRSNAAKPVHDLLGVGLEPLSLAVVAAEEPIGLA